jgi:hypothetical protein
MQSAIKPDFLLIAGEQQSYSYACKRCGFTHSREVQTERKNLPFGDISLLQPHNCLRCHMPMVTVFYYSN